MSEAYWLDSVLSGFQTPLVPPKTSAVWQHPLQDHLDSIISLEIGTRKHLQTEKQPHFTVTTVTRHL